MYACTYISTVLNPSDMILKFHGVEMFAISSCFIQKHLVMFMIRHHTPRYMPRSNIYFLTAFQPKAICRSHVVYIPQNDTVNNVVHSSNAYYAMDFNFHPLNEQ